MFESPVAGSKAKAKANLRFGDPEIRAEKGGGCNSYLGANILDALLH
jgi:hypothetical protein